MRPVYALFREKRVEIWGKRISRNAGAAIRPRKGGAEASESGSRRVGSAEDVPRQLVVAGQRGEQQVVDALGIAVEILFDDALLRETSAAQRKGRERLVQPENSGK